MPGRIFTQSPRNDPEDRWTLTNKISAFAVIFSILGIVISALALVFTTISIGQTGEALRLAKSQSITADSLRIEERKEKIIRDSIEHSNDSIAFSLNRQLVDAQLSAVQQAQAQFEISNRPFIEVNSFEILMPQSSRDESKVTVKYNLENISANPVQIISQKSAVLLREVKDSTIPREQEFNMRTEETTMKLTMVTRGSPKIMFNDLHNINVAGLINIGYGNLQIFLRKQIIYRKVSDDSEYLYDFIVRVQKKKARDRFVNTETLKEFVKNENTPLKKSPRGNGGTN